MWRTCPNQLLTGVAPISQNAGLKSMCTPSLSTIERPSFIDAIKRREKCVYLPMSSSSSLVWIILPSMWATVSTSTLSSVRNGPSSAFGTSSR